MRKNNIFSEKKIKSYGLYSVALASLPLTLGISDLAHANEPTTTEPTVINESKEHTQVENVAQPSLIAEATDAKIPIELSDIPEVVPTPDDAKKIIAENDAKLQKAIDDVKAANQADQTLQQKLSDASKSGADITYDTEQTEVYTDLQQYQDAVNKQIEQLAEIQAKQEKNNSAAAEASKPAYDEQIIIQHDRDGFPTNIEQFVPNDKAKNVHVAITNQSVLDDYLTKTGNDLTGDIINFKNNENIVFPKNQIYTVGWWNQNYFEGYHGDIDFNGSTFLVTDSTVYGRYAGDQGGRTIKNATYVGAVGATRDGKYNTSAGVVTNTLLNVKNLTIDNVNYYASHASHVYDLVGVDNVTIKNSAIRGSLIDTSTSAEQLKNMLNEDWHKYWPEAIQFDESYFGSIFASDDLDFNNQPEKIKQEVWKGQRYTGLNSQNVTLDNMEFTGYQGLSAKSLAEHTQDEKISTFGGTVGSHSIHNTEVQNGYTATIKNSIFENLIGVDGRGDKQIAPIHSAFVMNSQEEWGKGLDRATGIARSRGYLLNDIKVENVQFIETPTNFYGKSGEKTTASIMQAWFDDDNGSDNNKVKAVVIKDTEGHLLETVKSYNNLETSKSYSNGNYRYTGSNFDKTTGTLTRIYEPLKVTEIKTIHHDAIVVKPKIEQLVLKELSYQALKVLLKNILIIPQKEEQTPPVVPPATTKAPTTTTKASTTAPTTTTSTTSVNKNVTTEKPHSISNHAVSSTPKQQSKNLPNTGSENTFTTTIIGMFMFFTLAITRFRKKKF